MAAPASSGKAWNELLDGRGQVRDSWSVMWERIKGWSPEDRRNLLNDTGRMLEDLGTTYNVYRDVGGAMQPYEIDPIPFIIGWDEWGHVAKGLAQRMRVLEAVLKDLYGPRKLLRDGLVPPDLVHASPAFHQTTRDVHPAGGKWLLATGCDLVRDSAGAWTVLRDHTHMPGGLGQTLENRSVVSSVLPDLFDDSKVARLRPFFDSEHTAIENLETSSGGVSSMVFLTPGHHHPSYFEHAYKARLLGVSLVEAADLTVRDHRLFMKTLGGLRKIDGVICRLDDDSLDPLEFWVSGGGGVPGLIEAWRSGNVVLMNAPGSGFAGSAALQAFLPLICREWFGEELLLPFVESWWLGQKSVREKMMSNLNGYILMSAFGRDKLLPAKWSTLSASSRRQWLGVIERRPWDFVVQKDIQPSNAPSIQSKNVQSLPVVWRAFTLNGLDKPVVLPGGLAKVGKQGVSPQLWPDDSGFTKDVWLTGTANTAGNRDIGVPISKKRIGKAPEVPSRIAEQLYWVGRYAERVESVSRMLRVTLRCIEGESGRRQRDQLDACLGVMEASKIMPKDVLKMRSVAQLSTLIFSKEIGGSLTNLVDRLIGNAASARDRLSDDTWIFFNQLKSTVDSASREVRAASLLRTLDKTLVHLAAFAGMQAENMIRGHGWRFLEIGRRIERGKSTCALLSGASEDDSALEPLIEVCDSVMTYRRRYFSKPEWAGVAELLFSEMENPRSVGFQIGVLVREAERLPGDQDFALMPEIRKLVGEIGGLVNAEEVADREVLKEISQRLELLSDKLTQHYFSHSVRRVY